MTKSDSTPDTSGPNDNTGDGVTVISGSPEGVKDTPVGLPRESDEASAPIKSFKLTKVKDEDNVVPGLVELVVVAEGTFVTEAGDVLRTGDRRLVGSQDAQVMLDAKVNGKSAFKEV